MPRPWMRQVLRPVISHHGLRLSVRSASTVVLVHPDQIFAKPPPEPHPWTLVHFKAPPPTTHDLQWRRCSLKESYVLSTLDRLQETLRSIHKRKVPWPADESSLARLPANEYLQPLLQPLVNLFNELHKPGVLPNAVQCIRVEFGDSINGVTFIAPGAGNWNAAPIIVSIPGALFDTHGDPSSIALFAVSKAFEHGNSTRAIIVTDFKDIAVFQSLLVPTVTEISSCQPALALRATTMAYMNEMTYSNDFLSTPDLEPDDEELAAGPPTDPKESLLPDEQVFATHQRYSDFDEPTLYRHPPRALQFFRWLKYAQEYCPKLVAKPDDEIVATTYQVPPSYARMKPLFPFDPHHELPAETLKHLNAIQRPSPLAASGVEDKLKRCKSFSLKIEDVITAGSAKSVSSLYRCRIISLDNQTVPDSPSICLKLYDDRFQPLEGPGSWAEHWHKGIWRRMPDEQFKENLVNVLPHYIGLARSADRPLMSEVAAYHKLRPVQGSIVPWFYGAYKFTLPEGMHLFGVLLEYIEGATNLVSAVQLALNTDRKTALIQSCRHGARVLDVADIAQCDWHGGQILFYTNPNSKIEHAIFVDFANTEQSYKTDELIYVSNYTGILYTLLDFERRDAQNQKQTGPGLVQSLLERFGEVDDWDPVSTSFSEDGKTFEVKAKDMFPFISST